MKKMKRKLKEEKKIMIDKKHNRENWKGKGRCY